MHENAFNQALEIFRQPKGWCISAIVHTERGFQDHKKTSAKLKEVEQAIADQLLPLSDKDTVKEYITRFEALTSELDFAQSKDGIGIFMDEANEQVIHFPFPVESKVIVDTSYEIRDVLYGQSRLTPYYVLVLGKEDARLYDGYGDKITQVSDRMDLSPEERIYDDASGSWSYSKSRTEANTYHTFLDQIDDLFGLYLSRKRQPFILVGPETDINYFSNHTKHEDLLAGKLSGSYDHAPAEKVFAEIETLVDELSHRKVVEALEQLENSGGQSTRAQGIQAVWPLAFEGRVGTLIIERNYRQSGYSSEEDMSLFLEETEGANVFHKDAMDDLAEKVLQMQGKVMFADAGSMGAYGHVAALLRY